MTQNHPVTLERAEWIAAECMHFLASDPGRLSKFSEVTGVDLAEIRQQIREHSFLTGVLEYLLNDENLLLECVETVGIRPEEPSYSVDVLNYQSDY
jgi:hypothetical protein